MAELDTTPLRLLTDGSFEGLLTAVFEAFRLRLPVAGIAAEELYLPSLLEPTRSLVSDPEKAQRVWTALAERDATGAAMVRAAFLSGLPGIEDALWRVLQRFFAQGLCLRAILDEDIQTVYQAAWKVRGEIHAFLGLVRFERASDGTLLSVIAPDYDILGALAPHFSRRFPEETWMIADSKRGLCLCHQEGITELRHCDPTKLPCTVREVARLATPEDVRWQELWKSYYRNISVTERKNPRLMARNLPRKYWQYLPERQSAPLDSYPLARFTTKGEGRNAWQKTA